MPHVSNGKLDGFLIDSLKKDGIVSQAGVREGDIIKSVNGQKFTSVKKPLQAYEYLRDFVKMEESPLIKIGLLRAGKPHTFTYRILHNQ